jgi:hypothetical protein
LHECHAYALVDVDLVGDGDGDDLTLMLARRRASKFP